MNDVSTAEMGIKVDVPPPKNFTSIEQHLQNRLKEPLQQKQEPATELEQNPDKAKIDEIMANILNQAKPENPQQIMEEVNKQVPEEVKKSQGFIARIWSYLKSLFNIK